MLKNRGRNRVALDESEMILDIARSALVHDGLQSSEPNTISSHSWDISSAETRPCIVDCSDHCSATKPSPIKSVFEVSSMEVFENSRAAKPVAAPKPVAASIEIIQSPRPPCSLRNDCRSMCFSGEGTRDTNQDRVSSLKLCLPMAPSAATSVSGDFGGSPFFGQSVGQVTAAWSREDATRFSVKLRIVNFPLRIRRVGFPMAALARLFPQ